VLYGDWIQRVSCQCDGKLLQFFLKAHIGRQLPQQLAIWGTTVSIDLPSEQPLLASTQGNTHIYNMVLFYTLVEFLKKWA